MNGLINDGDSIAMAIVSPEVGRLSTLWAEPGQCGWVVLLAHRDLALYTRGRAVRDLKVIGLDVYSGA